MNVEQYRTIRKQIEAMPPRSWLTLTSPHGAHYSVSLGVNDYLLHSDGKRNAEAHSDAADMAYAVCREMAKEIA